MRCGAMIACCLALCLARPASAAAPSLQAGVFVQDGGAPLSVEYHAAPEVVDWDNDGRKDLVVGQFVSGRIHLFLNTGTDAAPAFSGSSFIQSSGSPIQVSYG